tara:strand:+ start:2512 stop:3099 length:588 start_codon:yes stop_codon:yes gene_type:complete
MTNSVTLLADHKGYTKPKAVADEYVSLGDCDITAYRTGTTATADNLTIAANATANTYTVAGSTTAFADFQVGDHIVITDSASANNALVSRITTLTNSTDSVMTVVSVAGTDSGGNEEITHAGEKILASSFGLASVSHVELVGQENHDVNIIIGDISNDKTFFYLYAYTTGSAALLSASLASGDIGKVRLKVTGNL